MSAPPYVAPFISSAGLTVSNYQSILNDNLQAFLNIYGRNQYVGADSAIYQLISIFSLKTADVNLGLQLAYNQSSPFTAVGAGLDRAVKMNGLARAPFTYSTVPLTLSGVAGTVINNGFAQDVNGNLWSIPSPTTLVGGTASVLATCTTPGNVTAQVGQVSLIATPVSGWASVTNPTIATPGVSVESDSKLRARQAISVALPSVTTLQSTIAAVLAVPGVTRICPGYPTPGGPGTSIENPTGTTDSWGNPAHSISMVVEGGADVNVATAIYGARGIGCFTNGTSSVTVADPNNGYLMTIRFFRPTYTPLMVQIQIRGYVSSPTTATLLAVQQKLVSYLNTLNIGETVSLAALYYEAMSLNNSLTTPTFGVSSLLIGVQAAATTVNTTNGSSSVVVASATGIVVGNTILGAGIPFGTTVTGIAGTTLTLSAAATATATGVSMTFGTLSAFDVTMANFNFTALGTDNNVSTGIF